MGKSALLTHGYAFTDRYLPAMCIIMESGTEYLYCAKSGHSDES